MGNPSGAKVLALLRKRYPSAFLTESRTEYTSHHYNVSHSVIIDVNIDIRHKPPDIVSGQGLVNWFYRTRVWPYYRDGKRLVLVFDSGRDTPLTKRATHKKYRPVARAQGPDGPLFASEKALPKKWMKCIASGYMRLALFEFLLIHIQHKLSGDYKGVVYAHLPSSDVSHYDTEFLSGNVVELTSTGANHPPATTHGEGDLRCRVWSDHLAHETRPTVVRAFDYDMLAVYLARELSGRVMLHIRNPSSRTAEFINIPRLHELLKKDSISRVRLTAALVACGSDYFEGVSGIGGDRIVHTILTSPDEGVASVWPITDSILMRAAAKGKSYVAVSSAARLRAEWNMLYLSSELHPPAYNHGWRRHGKWLRPREMTGEKRKRKEASSEHTSNTNSPQQHKQNRPRIKR